MVRDSVNAIVGIEEETYVNGLFQKGHFDDVFLGMDSYEPVGLELYDSQSDTVPGKKDPLFTMAVELGIDGIIRMKDLSYPVCIDVKHLGDGDVFKFQLLKDCGTPGSVYNDAVRFLFFASKKTGTVYIVDRGAIVKILEENKAAYSLVPGETLCPLVNVKSSGFGQLDQSKPKSLWWVVRDRQKISPAIVAGYRFSTTVRRDSLI